MEIEFLREYLFFLLIASEEEQLPKKGYESKRTPDWKFTLEIQRTAHLIETHKLRVAVVELEARLDKQTNFLQKMMKK